MNEQECEERRQLVKEHGIALIDNLVAETDESSGPVGVIVVVGWLDGKADLYLQLHDGLTEQNERNRAIDILEKALVKSIAAARTRNSI